MRALALDIGDVRTGIAVSDARGCIANPLKVLPTQEVLCVAKSFRYILEDYEPDVLVCGCPMSLSGEENEQKKKIEATAHSIANTLNLPLVLVDERLSSVQAKRLLRTQGFSEKQMRGKIDMIAASIFLQTWLDAQKNELSKEN